MLTKILAISCIAILPAFSATISAENKPLKVVSLNMAGETDFKKIMWDFDRNPEIRNADLFLLQECAGSPDGSTSIAKDLAQRLKMSYLFKSADPNGGGMMKGLGIVSRYPFRDPELLKLEHINLHFKSRDRIALAVTVDSPAGPIRVFDVHLDSRVNKAQRLRQLGLVLQSADSVTMPCLIGGDLNTVHILWLSHTIPVLNLQDQAEAVRELMASHGFSTPFGDKTTFPLAHQKLDWVYLRGLKPVSHDVTPMPFSDHHAISLGIVQ
jgi:endonuclease/exonuclease/phosphatase family metal-dependent hydrolase